ILQDANEILLGLTKGRRGRKSRSSSRASSEPELKPEVKDFVVVSDSSLSDSDESDEVYDDDVADNGHGLLVSKTHGSVEGGVVQADTVVEQ
ncbi:hypothetical protein DXG01_014040, partial [Tephrocybe rancida]